MSFEVITKFSTIIRCAYNIIEYNLITPAKRHKYLILMFHLTMYILGGGGLIGCFLGLPIGYVPSGDVLWHILGSVIKHISATYSPKCGILKK